MALKRLAREYIDDEIPISCPKTPHALFKAKISNATRRSYQSETSHGPVLG